jgi:hypothetical protein
MAKLPQFSRNYGSRGGAYERPTTVVDTPSSNPWAKAIETMGRITAEQISKRSKNNSVAVQQTQKYLDQNAKFVLDSYDEFSDNMEKVGVNNPSLNQVGLFAIDKKANAYMGMKSARSKQEQAEFAKEYAFWDGKINELGIVVNSGKEADTGFTADYIDGYANVNMPNGVSTVNMNEGLSKQYQLAMPARIGATRNPKEQWFFDENDNWKLKTMYTSDQITNAFNEGEIDNNYIVADPKVLFAFDGGKIDDLASARNKFLVESGIIDEKTKKYTDDYVLGVKQGTTEDGKYNYQFRPRNQGKIEGTTSVFVNSQARSYAKYPHQAMNLWNTTLGQGANIDPAIVKNLEKQFGVKYRQDETGGYKLDMSMGDTGTAFNPESVALLEAAIADFTYSDLRDGNDSNYTLAPKATESEKEDAVQTQKAKNYFKRVEDYLDSTEGLPVPPPGLLFVNAQLTDEGRRFKSDLQKLVSTTGGKVVEFTEDLGTQEVYADIQYGDQTKNPIRVTEAQFKDPNVFKALLKEAVGLDATGSGVVQANYYNQFKDNK